MSDSFFIDSNNRKVISSIYTPTLFNVHVEDTGSISAQKFHISVDKLNSSDLLVRRFKYLFETLQIPNNAKTNQI